MGLRVSASLVEILPVHSKKSSANGKKDADSQRIRDLPERM